MTQGVSSFKHQEKKGGISSMAVN